MNARFVIVATIASCMGLIHCEGNVRADEVEIAWQGTRAYDRLVKDLPISPTQAHELLVERTEGRRNAFFDPYPLMLIDGHYLFTIPEKTYTRLEGFYVDATSGAVEYRWSDEKLTSKRVKSVPRSVFTRTETVNRQSDRRP